MSDHDECDCARCTVHRWIEETYPGGLEPAEAQEILDGLADVCGNLLSGFTDASAQSFYILLANYRQQWANQRRAKGQNIPAGRPN